MKLLSKRGGDEREEDSCVVNKSKKTQRSPLKSTQIQGNKLDNYWRY